MNLALDAIQFARPDWLWALLALPVLAWIWWRRRRRAEAWRDAVDPHLLAHLLEARPDRRGLLGLAAWLAAGLLAVLALAGPGWREAAVPLDTQGMAPLVVAIDLSTASTASDLPPSRLLQARAKLSQLLAERAGGQVALVAYADDAFTVAPLTDDARNVALYLDALSPEIMPVDGHRPDRAIAHATRLLRQGQALRGDIVLVTGDADAAAVAEADIAARMGYRVSVLGLGTAAGAAYRDADGALAHARLETVTLRALAVAGDGRYHALSIDDADLRALGVLTPATTGAGGAAHADAGVRRVLDQGYWLLLPLLALVLLAFRRGSGFACVAVLALLPVMLPAQAQPPVATPWQRADQVADSRMRDGASAYRGERYEAALDAWRGLPGADAAYNRGNALARLGRFDEAIAAYDDALSQQPGMDDALANRAAVEAARKRKPPPGSGEDPRAPQTPRDGDSQPRPGDAGDPADNQPGDAQGQGETRPPPAGRDAQPTDVTPPADAEAQREADAQQREQMERALAGQAAAPDQSAAEAGTPGADAADEREQANAAWLRRVPDDPGGLLRAKFRLEHERRAKGGDR